MPGHSGPDPHEHGRPVRPKSSSAGRRSNLKTKMNTTGTSVGTGSAGRKHGSRGQKKVQIQQDPPQETETQETVDAIEAVENQNEASVNDDVNGVNGADEHEQDEHETTDDENSRTRFTRPESDTQTAKPETPPPSLEPEVFTLEKFNNTMDSFSDIFSQNKFTNVTDDYPVEDLVTLVNDVTKSIEEYKEQTLTSQRHLDELQGRMRDVKERIQTSVQKKTNAIRMSKYFFFIFFIGLFFL